MDPRFSLVVSTGDKMDVRQLWINEGLSQLFQVDLSAVAKTTDLNLAGILGNDASFKLDAGARQIKPHVPSPAPHTRTWKGIVRSIDQTRVDSKGVSTYHLVIVPKLWALTQKIDNRIFQHKKLPEIAAAVLGEWGIDFDTKYNEDYKKHEYVVQYAETDYAFLCRILEEAGITHYFSFDGGDTKLVLADNPQKNDLRAPPINHDPAPLTEDIEYLTEVQLFHVASSNKVTQRDFDFRRRPDYELFGKATTDSQLGPLEQYEYQPGGFLVETGGGGDTPVADDKGVARHDDGEGAARAARVMASLDIQRRVIDFIPNTIDLAPGAVFTLVGHPRGDLAKPMLVTQLTTYGSLGGQISFEAEAVFNDKRYVPDLVTPKPRILGVQSAVVVGPPGEEIHVDEFGRARVQFHWDRKGKYDDNSSSWIRVSQNWAGPGYGMMLLPRVGHEVLVGFFDGDPDQPVIIGRVYNGESRVPYTLPEYKTRSTWRSHSSAGFNEIMFEDEKTLELVYVQAQLDLKKIVNEEETERTGKLRNLVVGQMSEEVVAKLDSTMAGKRHVIEMIRPPRCPRCGAPADPNSKTCTATVNKKPCGQPFEPPKSDDLHILDQDKPDVISLPTKVDMIEKRVIFTTGKASVVFRGDDLFFEANEDITFKAKGDDMFIEGKLVLVNTMEPPGAPKPDKLPPMEPGCFKGQKTDP